MTLSPDPTGSELHAAILHWTRHVVPLEEMRRRCLAMGWPVRLAEAIARART